MVNGGVVSFANGELAGKNNSVLSATRTTMYFFFIGALLEGTLANELVFSVARPVPPGFQCVKECLSYDDISNEYSNVKFHVTVYYLIMTIYATK